MRRAGPMTTLSADPNPEPPWLLLVGLLGMAVVVGVAVLRGW